jgi:hypothetical protein
MRDRSKTHQTSETDAAEKTGSPSHDRIAVRAYELFEQRGHSGGAELEDWLQAEGELRGGRRSQSQRHERDD